MKIASNKIFWRDYWAELELNEGVNITDEIPLKIDYSRRRSSSNLSPRAFETCNWEARPDSLELDDRS